jgi:hypothetical protein
VLLRVQKIAEFLISATSISDEVTPITAAAAEGLLFLGQHRGFSPSFDDFPGKVCRDRTEAPCSR